MNVQDFLRVNETRAEFFNRCDSDINFDCSEDELLWWTIGARRLPLKQIVPLTVLLVFIFLTGVVGNVCVCYVIIKHPGLHTATNYYLFSLAISDLLLLLFGLPNELYVYWHQYPYDLGLGFCKTRNLISEAATYVSVLTVTAFSLERYLAICHPLHVYAMAGLRRASRIIVVLWMIAVVCAAPFAVYTEIVYRVEYPPNSGKASLKSAFCKLMVISPLLELSSVFFFFLPALLILYLYVRMGLQIRSTRVSEKSCPGLFKGAIHGENRQNKSRKTVVRMLVAVVIAFFVCWAPFHIQRVFYIYGYALPMFEVINEYLYNIAGPMYYISATVNPILYNVISSRYRTAFRESFLCQRESKLRTATEHSCRAGLPSSVSHNTSTHRESKISFISKVDGLEEEPRIFGAKTEVINMNGIGKVYLED